MKKVTLALLIVLAVATAVTVGCSGASKGSQASLPTYTELPFLSNRTTPQATPFLMNLDGTNVTAIALTPSDSGYWFSSSADLSVVAFEDDGNIWVSNASGSTQTQLTTDGDYAEPRVSPDAKKLFYAHDNESTGVQDAFVANVDGSSPINLSSTITSSSVYCFNGSFSADSSQVVFVCWDDNAGFGNLYTANADGTGLAAVLSQSSFCNDWCDTPAFSQDGTKIVFASWSVPTAGTQPHRFVGPHVPNMAKFKGKRRPTPKGTTPETTYGIASMNVDGTGLTTFTPGAYELEVLNGKIYYTFYNNDNDTYQIFSSNIDGSSAVALTDGTTEDYLGLED
jgi:WD40-like Beta Propeller Repeat